MKYIIQGEERMDYNYGYENGIGIVGWLFYIAVIAFLLVTMWKVYEKAGKPGWANLIPFYNLLVMLEIVGKPWWYLLLMFIPIVNIVISIMVTLDMAKVFGKGSGFGIGLIFLPFIFYPILAFGDAKYQGTPAPSY
jgi:ABC-type sulfate transport system permease subunit